MRLPKASLTGPVIALAFLSLALVASSRTCSKERTEPCKCKDEPCTNCFAPGFGGCCYKYRQTADSKYNCSATDPGRVHSIKRDCDGGGCKVSEKGCAECSLLGERGNRCLECSRGYEMIFMEDVRACCESEEADQLDKIVANITLGFIGIGALATASVLLWYFYVRRKPRSYEDDNI